MQEACGYFAKINACLPSPMIALYHLDNSSSLIVFRRSNNNSVLHSVLFLFLLKINHYSAFWHFHAVEGKAQQFTQAEACFVIHFPTALG